MIKVTIIEEDRGVTSLEGVTPEQIVGYLWKLAFIREASPWEYMHEVSKSVKIWNGCEVRYKDAGEFLEDLEAAGILMVEWGESDDDEVQTP